LGYFHLRSTFGQLLISTFLVFSCSFHSIIGQSRSKVISHQADQIIFTYDFKSPGFTLEESGKQKYIDYTFAQDESTPGKPKLPSKNIFVALPPEAKITSVGLSNIERNIIKDVIPKSNPIVEMLKDSSLTYKEVQIENRYLTSDKFPSAEYEIIGYTWIGDYYCGIVKINTHQFDWKKKEIAEILHAEISIKFNAAGINYSAGTAVSKYEESISKIIANADETKEFRSKRKVMLNDTTGNWIGYSNQFYKLAVVEDGIHVITFDDLVSYGIDPVNINPKSIQIFWKGIEQPIYINGEADLRFDTGDYIEFWCEKNYGSEDYREIVGITEDYKNYMDRYCDTTFVWLTYGLNNGIRAELVFDELNTTDTVSSGLVKLHLEDDQRLWYYDAETPRTQLPDWQEHKVWTWQTIGSSGYRTINFETPEIVPNTNVTAITRLISQASDGNSNAHKQGHSINGGSIIDTVTYDYKETVNLMSEFSSSLLNAGQNYIRVHGLPAESGFQQSLIDWIDVEYLRNNNGLDEELLIRIPDTVTTAQRSIKIDEVNITDFSIFKVKPAIKKITNHSFSQTEPATIYFTDKVSGGDEYYFVSHRKRQNPVLKKKHSFENLRHSAHQADYIIITSKCFAYAAGSYRNEIQNNYDVKVEIVFVEDIYDEFNYGYMSAESIKEFLKAAHDYWQSPAPSYLLIMGDANYDYKDKWTPVPDVRKKNFVPGYGFPVSDPWYAVWDTGSVAIPQMFVGRIPATSHEEMYSYVTKHRDYLLEPYGVWNKRFLFFSGGNPSKPSELEQIYEVNQEIMTQIAQTPQIGGYGKHFYKTIDPVTNFGPYSLDEVENEIDEGGIIISYVGHSGTQTWDNGITSVEQLSNKYRDRFPLISDFGCSTGKFAEPDIDAFGELFVRDVEDGKAIAYLGNSSWGFLSTSLRFPKIFYDLILQQGVHSIGEAHLLAKIEQMSEYGINDVNKVFTYNNLLFGDPILSLRLPEKSNFVLNDNSIEIIESDLNETLNEVNLQVLLFNYGICSADSVNIEINISLNGAVLENRMIKTPPLLYSDTLIVSVPVQNMPGEYCVSLSVDPNNIIDEINEDDNSASIGFTIHSVSLRPLIVDNLFNNYFRIVKLLNPINAPTENVERIKIQLDTTESFITPTELYVELDTLFTEVEFPPAEIGKRYWWRGKLDCQSSSWSVPYSSKYEPDKFEWLADEPLNGCGIVCDNVVFDSTNSGWRLQSDEKSLTILSAGQSAGSFVSVEYEGNEYLPNTYFWGLATAEIDTVTYEPSNPKYFVYPSSTSAPALIDYINSLPDGAMLAMTVCDDGAQSVLGYSGGTPVREAIKTLGSSLIDDVRYRESWCMLGKKGAAAGSVPESYKPLFEGTARIDVTKIARADSGSITFPMIGPVAEWDSSAVDYSLPGGSQLKVYPIVYDNSFTPDTLEELSLLNNVTPLQTLDAETFPYIKIVGKFFPNEDGESPRINSVSVDVDGSPELGTNYQISYTERDTVMEGEDPYFYYGVSNMGTTQIDSLKIHIEFVKADGTKEMWGDQFIESLQPGETENLTNHFGTITTAGQRYFNFNIDPDDEIKEIYSDNNNYSIPFYMKRDTSRPMLEVTFDGINIFDGDFVSPEPEINIKLTSTTRLSIRDTSSIQLYLDELPVNYLGNEEEVFYQKDISNRSFHVDYHPHLSDGEHSLKIIAKDQSGNYVDSSGVVKQFVVSAEDDIVNLYNYPNPFSSSTHFTFKLTAIPDELIIKIFTLAGRLVKEITLLGDELKLDFNKIYWDSKDEDGDKLGNGVYLYKVIMKTPEATKSVIQKMAIVR